MNIVHGWGFLRTSEQESPVLLLCSGLCQLLHLSWILGKGWLLVCLFALLLFLSDPDTETTQAAHP